MVRRKVLVCGATGFIGRNLLEALSRRDDLEVHALRFEDPSYPCPGVQWRQADLRRPEAVAEAVRGMDVVIQAAATTSGFADTVARPYIHVTDNAVMNSLLLRAVFEAGVGHFVFFSCSVMYASREEAQAETDFRADDGIYPRYFAAGWTKLYIEKMCEFFAGLGRTRHTVIRHSNIYGPHDKFDLERSHVLGATVTKAMTAPTGGTVTVWGTGEEARDLLHVDDLVDLVERVIDRQTDPFVLVNAGTGTAVKVRDLVRMIVAASGRDLRIEHDLSKPSAATTVALDSRRARDLFGWEPRVTLEEGLRRTIAWWKAEFGGSGPREG